MEPLKKKKQHKNDEVVSTVFFTCSVQDARLAVCDVIVIGSTCTDSGTPLQQADGTSMTSGQPCCLVCDIT